MSLELGAQLWTVKDFTKNPADLKNAFKKLGDIGYRAVQVSGIGRIDPKELNDIACENSLKIVVTHTPQQAVLTDTQKVSDMHKIFGCNMVGIGARPDEYADTLEDYRAFIRDFDKAAKILYDNGMKLHYHNHEFEFTKSGGLVLFDVLINETDPSRWAFIPDVFWIQVGGRNPASQLKALKGRADVCHLKDYLVIGSEVRQAEVGEGNLYWDEIIQACIDAGIKYAMVEQDECYGADPFDALTRSFNNYKKIIAGMKKTVEINDNAAAFLRKR